jgi:CheY-like chemotaxis protein
LKRRALLVEDEVLVALLIEEMLGDLGCEVGALSSHFDEALRLATDGSFDFAVLDINLNGTQSFPIADRLAERGVPFLFATGYGAGILPERHAKAVILHKPYSLADLRAALARLPLPG